MAESREGNCSRALTQSEGMAHAEELQMFGCWQGFRWSCWYTAHFATVRGAGERLPHAHVGTVEVVGDPWHR